MLKTSDFDFSLPPELIAQYPLKSRTESRLLVTSRDEKSEIQHKKFGDLIDFLSPGDLLVFNNSKVMKARFFGKKSTGGKVEFLVERIFDPHHFLAHVGSNKSLKLGTEILLEGISDTVARIDQAENGLFRVSLRGANNFSPSTLPSSAREEVIKTHPFESTQIAFDQRSIWALMETIGHIPLPTYITRSDEITDASRYQTVYAKTLGSVAAPTAGLHFDERLLAQLSAKGIEFAEVTLHVGAGTFKPVKTENLHEHQMHSEWIEVPELTCQKINETHQKGKKVFAVGTTTVRSLESAAKAHGLNASQKALKPYLGETSIFITPPYEFQVVDGLITNFHLPKSTLIMLVSAFSSRENILHCYEKAIQQKYRFFSYGDAMLIR